MQVAITMYPLVAFWTKNSTLNSILTKIIFISRQWISSFTLMCYPTYSGYKGLPGLLYWNLSTKRILFTLTCRRLLIGFHMLGWFLKVGHMELMVNCYNGLKIFYIQQKTVSVFEGYFSDWVDIFSGVPRESVLGPILFLVYVNDLPDSVLSNLYIFSDDTKLHRAITEIKTIVIFYNKTWITSHRLG